MHNTYLYVRDLKTGKDKRPRYLICKRDGPNTYVVKCLVRSENWAQQVVGQLNRLDKDHGYKQQLS